MFRTTFLSFLMAMVFAITTSGTATTASADGWSVEGRYLMGRTVSRYTYGALSLSGTSDFRSYGVVGSYGWRLGESPYTLSFRIGGYGGGVSERGEWTSGGDTATLAYNQPLALTAGARFSADYARWSPYLEAGLVATNHRLTGSLTQGGVTTTDEWSARTFGIYAEAGAEYCFSSSGCLNVAIQGRRSVSGSFEQTTLAGSLGVAWRF